MTSLYEAAVPTAEKCLNYVKSVEESRSAEVTSAEANNFIEAETHLSLLEPAEAVADTIDERHREFFKV